MEYKKASYFRVTRLKYRGSSQRQIIPSRIKRWNTE